MRNPFSVSVFEDHVYWSTQEKGEVFRQDKFGRGTNTKLLTGGPWLTQVSVYQQQRYNSIASKRHTFLHQQLTIDYHNLVFVRLVSIHQQNLLHRKYISDVFLVSELSVDV